MKKKKKIVSRGGLSQVGPSGRSGHGNSSIWTGQGIRDNDV